MAHFDVVVCGLGVMGSAAVHHLARRGKRVLGLERYAPGHDRGSSHGRPASFGLAISSIPPMSRCCGAPMRCGVSSKAPSGDGFSMSPASPRSGRPTSTLVKGTLACARLHGLRHDVLAAPELMRRFPGLQRAAGLCRRHPAGGRLSRRRAVDRSAARARDRGGGGNSQRRIGPGDRAGRQHRAHRHRSRYRRGRGSHRRGRRLDQIAAARARRHAASDPRGDGLVRSSRREPIFGRPLPGVHHRQPARHALRRPAAWRRGRQSRQAPPPR